MAGGWMAKREIPTETATTTGHKIEDFAEDLGRLLGTAQAKAEGWLGQRQQIANTLVGIRDTATKLLADLGHQAEAVVKRRGRPARSNTSTDLAPAPPSKQKRRKMSAAARKAVSERMKKYWAGRRKAAKEHRGSAR